MWPPLETAVRLQHTANIPIIIGAAIGVVATFISFWMGNVEKEYLRRETDEIKLHTEGAKAEAAKSLAAAMQAESNLAGANLRAEQARAAAAEANARAAEANKIAEGERLARLKIEERLAPRSIAATQASALSNRLKAYAGTSIDILRFGDTPEIATFHRSIEKLLITAGWKVFSTTDRTGLTVVGLAVGLVSGHTKSDDAARGALLKGLNDEGITASAETMHQRNEWPSMTMQPAGANNAGIRMYIGSKP